MDFEYTSLSSACLEEEHINSTNQHTTIDKEERQVVVGMFQTLRARSFKLIFHGFPLWLLVLDKTVCERVEFPEFKDVDELMRVFSGDESVLVQRCLQNIGLKKLRFGPVSQDKVNLTLIS